MRNCQARVRFPVFNGYEVRVILSRDMKATCRRLQSDAWPCSACFIPDGNRGYLIPPEFPDEGTIAHEASHAVQELFRWAGARRDEEAFAYHLDFIVGRIHKFIKRRRQDVKYSKNGLQLTEGFEGCRLVAYQDQGGVWTIAYGHTRGVYPGMTCTQEQAEAWLQEDIAFAEANVNAHVRVQLTQGEYDGLVDFDFNCGSKALDASNLLRLVNAGDLAHAANEFERWDHVGGKVVAGLLRRRLAEKAEFLSA